MKATSSVSLATCLAPCSVSARADIAALRKEAGIRDPQEEREGHGEHGGREEREGRGEHGGREGHGEHGGEGEEGGRRIAKNAKWDDTRNGARLVLAYHATTQSSKGVALNTTARTLEDVRVEVHLSNGVELGPTQRTDLKPRGELTVELSAAGQEFRWWTTHPEVGNEEGHGPNHESGEQDARPRDAKLRPLYNELLLLRREAKMLREAMRAKQRGDGNKDRKRF